MANDKFTPLADLKAHYGSANFVHTNVSGLTADPTVQTKDDGLSTSDSNGTIQIVDSDFIRFQWRDRQTRDEIWDVRIEVFYSGNLTTLREIVGEMDRLNNVNNQDATRTYEVYIKDMSDKDSKIQGRISLTMFYNKLWSTAPT